MAPSMDAMVEAVLTHLARKTKKKAKGRPGTIKPLRETKGLRLNLVVSTSPSPSRFVGRHENLGERRSSQKHWQSTVEVHALLACL